jgi:protein-tyrosine phosphatase
MTGRIDVHSHLLPGIDDGCADLAESLSCARQLVAAGYTHSFCTPHYWPNLQTSPATVPQWTAALQKELDAANIPLRLYPGGEINLRPGFSDGDPEHVVSYGMARRYALVDVWAETLPDFFEPQIRWLQSLGMKVILAHPERMRAVQDQPELADYFEDLGMLMQGNLQCLSDPETALTRRVMERYLDRGRYFMLGTDLHNLRTIDLRLNGLKRATQLVGDAEIERMTVLNPLRILVQSGLISPPPYQPITND